MYPAKTRTLEADRARVSFEAFQEEVHNWDLTLARQQKKLKGLRTRIHSRIHLNQLDIIVTQIQAELIRYRKLLDPKKIQGVDLIQEYNATSRKFMEIMENIGAFADKIEEGDNEDTLQLDTVEQDIPQRPPRYHNQTFTYAISKESKAAQFSNSRSKNISRSKLSHKNSFSKQNRSMNLVGQGQKVQKKGGFWSGGNQGSEEMDAWEIRYQLKEIKSMMSQIRNEIKFHNHEDVEVELAKIQHNNKKMSLELKGLREDNQYIGARMQKLRDQLAAQKEIQAQMIQEFEQPRRSRKSMKGGVSQTQHCSLNQEVSDWVKVRI